MEMGIWEVTELLPEMECGALVDRGGFDTMKECQNALILLGSGSIYMTRLFFFLEYAKDLRIIVIKKKKSLTIHTTRFQ